SDAAHLPHPWAHSRCARFPHATAAGNADANGAAPVSPRFPSCLVAERSLPGMADQAHPSEVALVARTMQRCPRHDIPRPTASVLVRVASTPSAAHKFDPHSNGLPAQHRRARARAILPAAQAAGLARALLSSRAAAPWLGNSSAMREDRNASVLSPAEPHRNLDVPAAWRKTLASDHA